MRPVEFDEQTIILGKPEVMTDEECAPLPVFRDGKQVISCWELTKEDLEEVARTGKVYLCVTGGSHPPLHLQTESPFK